MNFSWVQHLFQKRMLIILALGFASGLPLGLTSSTLQSWYTIEGVDIVTIGFLALVGQPYVYKFIWAPFMDRYTPSFLGRRRGWLVITQGVLVASLLAMALFNPQQQPVLLALIALMVAVASASQDIAFDAYRTEILPAEERGTGAAMSVAGYRIAMLISGGLTLILADYVGFQITYMLMAACMATTMIVTLIATEPEVYKTAPQNLIKAVIEPFQEFLSRDTGILLLALVLLYKIGDAYAGVLTYSFLLRGVEFTLAEVGYINKTVGLVATLMGVFAGGIMMSRVGLFKSLLWFGIMQALSNLTYMYLAHVGHDYMVMITAVFFENFGGGLGTAAFIALIMSLCDKRYTATQFALLTALSSVGRVFIGPIAGKMVDMLGWSHFFAWSLVFSLPGLVLLVFLKSDIDSADQKGKEPEVLEPAS